MSKRVDAAGVPLADGEVDIVLGSRTVTILYDIKEPGQYDQHTGDVSAMPEYEVLGVLLCHNRFTTIKSPGLMAIATGAVEQDLMAPNLKQFTYFWRPQ